MLISLIRRHTVYKCFRNKIRLCRHKTAVLSHNFSSIACCMNPVPVQGNKTLRDCIAFRKGQAQRSVLIEVSQSKCDHVLNLCKTFGEVKEFLPYRSSTGKIFRLVEFNNFDEVNTLLKTCSYRGLNSGLPVFSRLLYYNSGGNLCHSEDVHQGLPSDDRNTSMEHDINDKSVAVQMTKLYDVEKLSDVDTRLRFLLCSVVEGVLSGMLPFCKILPHESTINGFGCHSSSLNMLLNIFPKIDDMTSPLEFPTKRVIKFENCQDLHILNAVGDILDAFLPGISNVQKRLLSKSPRITFHSEILGINCDIILNDISLVYLSELLFLCSELDAHVKPLIITLKTWANEVIINRYDKESSINDLALTLMAIFFLQTRQTPVLPSLCEVEQYGTKQDCTPVNAETLEILLKEFFMFLGNFPFRQQGLSAYTGKSYVKPDFSPLHIQNPVNQQSNVSDNVRQEQLDHLQEAARSGLWNLETFSDNADFSTAKLCRILSMGSSRIS